MATMKIKKGDTVKVIAGADKGTEGKVIAVNHKNNTVLVEGVNMITKHILSPKKLLSARDNYLKPPYTGLSQTNRE